MNLVGCASVIPNFDAKQNFWKDKSSSVGVAVVKIPVAKTHKSGTQGLLDLAINNSMSTDLDKHLATFDVTPIKKVTTKIVAYLTSRGINAKEIKKTIDVEKLKEFEGESSSSTKYLAVKNFTSLKSELGVDKLLLLSVDLIGTIRNYYGFIPTNSPTGYSLLRGRVINLKTNELEWNQVVSKSVHYEGEDWDTPPNFPELTNALTKAYEQSRNSLFTSLSN